MTPPPWFPPAPAAGPVTVVALPGAAWSMEPKVNGCRVLLSGAGVWTRHGLPLSRAKGSARLQALQGRWSETLTALLEGEYVAATGTLWLFDVPEAAGPYDVRVQVLAEVVAALAEPWVRAMPRTTTAFRRYYARWRREGFEGVVLKRRASVYPKCSRPNQVREDWLKRRFAWD